MPRLNVEATKACEIANGFSAHGDDEIVLVKGMIRQHVGHMLGGPECL